MRLHTAAMIAVSLSMILAPSPAGLFAQPPGLSVKTIEYPREVVGVVAGFVVRDGTDEMLQRVQVKAFRIGGKAPLAVRMTDRRGRFRFDVKPGEYRLRFFLLGFDIVEV